jgi:AraC-like DNA-binding protein
MPRYKARDVDPEQVRKLAGIGCTQDEIAVIVGLSKPTLRKHFAEQMSSGLENFRMSLRRLQAKKAAEGNVTMLIWLGKQYLGQSDRQEQKITEEVVTIERIAPKIGLAESA